MGTGIGIIITEDNDVILSEKAQKLPKYVQEAMIKQQREINSLKQYLDNAEKANHICQDMEWFTLGLHTPEPRNLYLLDKDNAKVVATIGAGSILLIGRPKNK